MCYGTDAGAERVVDARGGGSAGRGGLEMAVGAGVGAGGCDSHCLLRCVSCRVQGSESSQDKATID